MRRYHSLGELPLGGPRRVIAIGTFDGVHLGHQAIIGHAVGRARELGRQSMVMSFHPNPITVLRPDVRTSILTGQGYRAALVERLDVDELLVVPFNRAFAKIRAERFVEMLSSAPLGADVVVVGEGFRYGHGGEGTVSLMRDVGRSLGLQVEVPPLVASPDGKPISSTRIRRLLSQGQVREAAALLGRPHAIEGIVIEGDKRGRAIGVPTANVAVEPVDAAIPGRGVYAGTAVLGHGREAAAINVGLVPTFVDSTGVPRPVPRVEAHLIDYAGPDIYGRPVRLEIVDRIRDERRFDGVEALVAQIREDIARAREILGPGAGR